MAQSGVRLPVGPHMKIKIVEKTITLDELRGIASEFYQSMVKGAVDIETRTAAFGGEYHIDASNALIEDGSRQENIWGFNIQLGMPRESWIEYTSLINIKPEAGNRDMEVQDPVVRDNIKNILEERII